MAKRGRPAKVLSNHDLIQLLEFVESLPYPTDLQFWVLNALTNGTYDEFNEEIFKRFKIVDRYRVLYQQRQSLLEQIKLKQHNQQKLADNEVEILTLASQEQDRETYFRLDRALESYQKIYKAVFNDRIRLENEHRRDVLNKSRKTLTEAQIKRNEENRRKYELGGAVLVAFEKLGIDINADTPDQIKNRIVNSAQFVTSIKRSKIFKEVSEHQKDFFKKQNLFVDVLQGLATWTNTNKPLSTIEIEKHESKYE
ncbi:hypothetical protein [Acinetobacter puyangensis]|uniref:hypothetical protein n=1 Tax=Acinetobacter puyangensis TaxID=1096779 RepID=UPI003A4DABD4